MPAVDLLSRLPHPIRGGSWAWPRVLTER